MPERTDASNWAGHLAFDARRRKVRRKAVAITDTEFDQWVADGRIVERRCTTCLCVCWVIARIVDCPKTTCPGLLENVAPKDSQISIDRKPENLSQSAIVQGDLDL